MSGLRRILLALYGIAIVALFTWVPWRGGPTIRGANTEVLGYGFVWSGPKRPAAFAEYDKLLAEYSKQRSEYDKAYGDPIDLRAGYVSAPPGPKGNVEVPPASSPTAEGPHPSPREPQPPKEPGGYSSYPYKLATATVDRERLLLELGALSGLMLTAWVLTSERKAN